jgi:hypothetical protein
LAGSPYRANHLRHRLGRVELASTGKRPAVCRVRTLIDARSAGLHRPHLLFVRQDGSAKPDATAEVEMTTVRVVPLPRRLAGQRSVKVNWVHHVSDLGMFDLDAHAATLRPHDALDLYDERLHELYLNCVGYTRDGRNQPLCRAGRFSWSR